jgi:hypothetical protein
LRRSIVDYVGHMSGMQGEADALEEGREGRS